MNIAIVQKVVGNYHRILEITGPVTAAYCDRQGYKHIVDVESWDEVRPPRWIKYPALLRAMVDNPKIEWFLWLDADIMVMDHSVRLETLLNLYDLSKVNVFAESCIYPLPFEIKDPEGEVVLSPIEKGTYASWQVVLAGSFLIKNCEWSRNFLRDLYYDVRFVMNEMSLKTLTGELAFTIYLLKTRGYKEYCKLLPLGTFMRIPDNREGEFESVKMYTPGDFMLHVPLSSIPRKEDLLLRFLGEVRY